MMIYINNKYHSYSQLFISVQIKNIKANGLEDKIKAIQGDGFSKMDKDTKKALSEAKAVYDLDSPMSAEEAEYEALIFEGLGGKNRKISPEIRKQEEDFEKWADMIGGD